MSSLPFKHVCVHWTQFGPYHLARLRAAHRYFQARQVELIGLETASRQKTYAWVTEDDLPSLRREVVFPDQVFEDVPPAQIHRAVTETLDRLAPDAVAIQSYSLPDARACLAWCRANRRVAVLMNNSRADDVPRTGWREEVKALLVDQYDAALLSGSAARSYLEQLGFPPAFIFLGYNVVDNDFFHDRAEAARNTPEAHRHLPGLDEDTPFFLASSRFIARKNLDVLLRAYRHYRTLTATPWRLILLGDGPDRERLERLIDKEGIDGVVLAGFRRHEELTAYYGLARAFVHTAKADQWGNVVNEAMAAGLPVLVSVQTGCAPELVAEGRNGFTFEADDTDRLAWLMHRLAGPETDLAEMGQASRRIISQWNTDRFAAQLWAAFEAGLHRADRPFSAAARLLLWAIRKTARSSHAFHTVEA